MLMLSVVFLRLRMKTAGTTERQWIQVSAAPSSVGLISSQVLAAPSPDARKDMLVEWVASGLSPAWTLYVALLRQARIGLASEKTYSILQGPGEVSGDNMVDAPLP